MEWLQRITDLLGSPYLAAVVGLALLIWGRRILQIALTVVGFGLGLTAALRFLPDQPGWIVLLVGVALGLILSILIVTLQKMAVGLGGFLVGGYGGMWISQQYGLLLEQPEWVAFLVGGIVAALLALALFKWALMLVSAAAGALLVLQLPELTISPNMTLMAAAALTLVGFLIQARQRRRPSLN